MIVDYNRIVEIYKNAGEFFKVPGVIKIRRRGVVPEEPLKESSSGGVQERETKPCVGKERQ